MFEIISCHQLDSYVQTHSDVKGTSFHLEKKKTTQHITVGAAFHFVSSV